NFEQAVATLEKARYAVALASGSATTSLVLQSLPIGAHVISGGDVYGGTHRYFTKVANTHGVEVSFVHDLAQDVAAALRPETALVWLETPSNPTLSVTDIGAVAAILKQHNENHGKDAFLVVDNTFLSPYVSNPLVHGADVVIHSIT
ncbi:hypothetical protein OXX59_009867, partial [Metschnikowia pulcherrima]